MRKCDKQNEGNGDDREELQRVGVRVCATWRNDTNGMDAGTLARSLGVRARDIFRHLLFPPQHSNRMDGYARYQLMSDASPHSDHVCGRLSVRPFWE